ncbi:MAG: mechanosensitive ion channel family protein [Candidatus Auribacter fodinae]|uniref:Mechanosensitive ion channel family protein n=1 Tax=Candidatus Auribacter fodinae TaxID=2093366 RepID=A0A3A4R6Z1_9BACT|nr:MAG: mechanosensitive ion channel family protein [Candidatus Auribacter fodinae]
MDFASAVQLITDKLNAWMETFIANLPNLILALLVIIGFSLIASQLKRVSNKLFSKISRNVALNQFLSTLVYLAVFIFGFMIAINILKLDKALLSVLAGIGVIGLALAFAFQDVASNFVAGIALVLRHDRPFKVGDIISTNGQLGIVEEINLRDTMIRTPQGQTIFLPNKIIFENAVINYSLFPHRRIDLSVGVSYGEDLEKVRDIAVNAVENLPGRAKDKDIELYFEEFGDSSINFSIKIWLDMHGGANFFLSTSEAIISIKKAFDKNNITIPFPIRTLDFGVKGGRTLSEMLESREFAAKR